MRTASSLLLRRPIVIVAVVVAMTLPASRTARGEAEAELDPTGGLRAKAGLPPAASGVTREELVRKWDLDGNGTIDASEAAVARVRMRRARREMEATDGIDPLTGRPRVADVADDQPADDGGVQESSSDTPPDRPKRSREPDALPGTRVPAPQTDRGTTGRPPAPAATDRGTVPRSSAKPGATTGGVRAGAPAARPGYGSLMPKTDLNAGRPRVDAEAARAGTRPGLPRGGLLPTPRIGPAGQPRPTPPRPAPPAIPAPPASRPPRVTADDIGGF